MTAVKALSLQEKCCIIKIENFFLTAFKSLLLYSCSNKCSLGEHKSISKTKSHQPQTFEH